ncbi:MAG: photosystem P840 reaction-center cytochrome c-551 [Chlorobiales bacterium]|nr:photosystem P840 reaction-center cytochrome c-551 [Chlorobiales bacterium]
MDNSKNKLLAVPLIGAVFFLVLFFLVSLVTGYKPYAEAASYLSVFKTIFGWLGLFAFASFVIIAFARMSQLITSGWFLGILIGGALTVGGSAIFLFTAAGPRTTTVDGKSIRSVKQLQAFLDGGTAAIDAAENPDAQKEEESSAPKVTGEAAQYEALFNKKCNACHTFKSVTSKFTTKYVAQDKIDDAIEMMRTMPNSGISKKDAEQISIYLKAAYGKKGAAEAPAATGAASTDSTAAAAAPADQAGGTAAAPALSPEDLKEGEAAFTKKCNSCHTFLSVTNNFKTKYVSQNKIEDVVEMMRKMPNSGITKKDSEKITGYLKATYSK